MTKAFDTKIQAEIPGLRLMHIFEPVCSPLKIFWSYCPITTEFDKKLLNSYSSLKKKKKSDKAINLSNAPLNLCEISEIHTKR